MNYGKKMEKYENHIKYINATIKDYSMIINAFQSQEALNLIFKDTTKINGIMDLLESKGQDKERLKNLIKGCELIEKEVLPEIKINGAENCIFYYDALKIKELAEAALKQIN